MKRMKSKYPMAQRVSQSLQGGQDEETLEPHVLVDHRGRPIGRFQEGDSVIFYNLRGEREVELCRSFLDKEFIFFPTRRELRLNFMTLIRYHEDLPAKVAFPEEEAIADTLSEVLSRQGLRQVKIAEEEKAVHISYFLNGKWLKPFPGEERILIPTFKDVPFPDQRPEMNAQGVADSVLEKLKDPTIDFIFANFANIDVIAHTGNEEAIRSAVEEVDFQLGRCLREATGRGWITIISADHGTAEKWYYPDGSIDTGHTDSPVPFIIVDPQGTKISLRTDGELTDIAPTILDIFKIEKPKAMTGRTLFLRQPCFSEKKPQVLFILLDGWGYRDEVEGNLISQADTPVMKSLQEGSPFITLRAAGEAVGLAAGGVGNSEAGHLHIGAGRRIESDRLRIDRAIEDGSFFRNEEILKIMKNARDREKNLHLIGILSFFSSHGSVNHLLALLRMAKQNNLQKLFVHAILGRRGEKKESGGHYIRMIEEKMATLGIGQVASAIGRYFALDREENWKRIEKTYQMLVYGKGIPVYKD